MAKLTVKNVGPIRETEIDVKKHTVFIGPQGTGKSTLAKLIAIGGDTQTFPKGSGQVLFEKYGLSSFLSSIARFKYTSQNKYSIEIDENLNIVLIINNEKQEMYNLIVSRFNDLSNRLSAILNDNLDLTESKFLIDNFDESQRFFHTYLNNLIEFPSIYITAERTLISLLADSIWGIISSGAYLPEMIKNFGFRFETARNYMNKFTIPYLGIYYQHIADEDRIFHDEINSVKLSQSASGYQSIIPLLLVVEHQRQQAQRRFIIEEPELNLYPIAQKDLIYSLIGGLQPDVTYQDAEWVITTHSPYVLTALNTLMLAYKVAQRSDELRAEVEKIIPARCWINPDEFAAYYVDNGTVRSIISEKTGLIADNELDDVSDNFADEQDKLFALSRSVPRA